MKTSAMIRAVVTMTILVVGFQNCANKAFTQLSSTDKTTKLATETIFPPPDSNTPGATPTPGSTPTGGGGTISTGGTVVIVTGGTTVVTGGTVTTGGTLQTGGTTSCNCSNNTIACINGILYVNGIVFGTCTCNATPQTPVNPTPTPGSTPTPTPTPPGATPTPPGATPTPEFSPTPTPTPTPTATPTPTPSPTPQYPVIPISFVCSDKRSDYHGNLATATNLTVEVYTKNKALACSFSSATLRDQLIQFKTFPTQLLSLNCANLADGQYLLRIRDSARSASTNLIVPRSNEFGEPLMKFGNWVVPNKKIEFLTDRNPDANSPDRSRDTVIPGIKCDRTASPLVIRLNGNVQKREHLILSAPEFGKLFDILGQNSYNAPYTPKRISWHSSNQYYYVVLPNSLGQVKGIDQLFGDNTLGPDGKFATNGYTALAKYDGMSVDGQTRVAPADENINQKDPIYSKLRLWQDRNFNAVVDAGELLTLSQVGVKNIDLRYDPNYAEVDKYGNETRYKSIVQTNDGRLHVIFDLWFKYLER